MPTSAPPDTQFKIIDLFAGPGGLDLAARQLGIPAVGIEWNAAAYATRQANGLEGEHGDVRDYGPDDERFGDCNVLTGGPPCQTFTVAGNGSGRRALDQVKQYATRIGAGEDIDVIKKELETLEDERTGLVLEPLRWAVQAVRERKKPYQAIVLEQVPAVLPVWEQYRTILTDLGYVVAKPRVLNTEEFGVPQTRRRAILIARWAGEDRKLSGDPHLPTSTHHRYRKGHPRTAGIGVSPWVAMEDVLTGRKGQAFKVVSNYGTGGDPKARGVRRHDEPSATVTGKISRNRVVSLAGDRELERLSPSEAGCLQTFPAAPTWEWSGNDIAQQIGNAVPPLLGMHVLAAALNVPRARFDQALAAHHPYALPNTRDDQQG